MLGQFPMVDNIVREQQRELSNSLRRVEEDFIPDNSPDRKFSVERLLKLIKR